jgi:hypothetical protein
MNTKMPPFRQDTPAFHRRGQQNSQGGLSFQDVDVIGFDDGDMRREFKDKNLEKEFLDYHRKVAQLQIIPTHGHRKFKR